MNSPSYQHLAPVYDLLFPLDSSVLAFVESAVGPLGGQRIVDAGCGTGLLARALGDRGARVFGFDLDPDLLATARTREGRGATFAEGDLRSWAPPPAWGTPTAILSFGNTLPHLLSEVHLGQFLVRCRDRLPPRGLLLIQILDYEFLERAQPWDLPVREVAGWTFRRHYEIRNGVWLFRTTLEGQSKSVSNVFPLRPWRRSEMETLLAQYGFSMDGVYGGFDLCPPGNTLPLVFVARRSLE